MPKSKPDISQDDLNEVRTGETRQITSSAARIRNSGVVVPIEKINTDLDEALHRVFHGDEIVSEGGGADDELSIDLDVSAFEDSAPVASPEVSSSDGIKTPLRPPSPDLLNSTRSGTPIVPEADQSVLSKTNGALVLAAAKLREQRIAESLREQALMEQRAHEAEKLRALLEEYVAETPSLPVAVSSASQKECDPVALDVQELIRVAHGKGNVVDRIDFQSQFRRLSEQYGEERFDTYLMSYLRLQQPLTLPYLNEDANNWHVSAKAHIATSGRHGPPKVLLFKSDFTPEGKKNRHQLVELVYILQGLPLAPIE